MNDNEHTKKLAKEWFDQAESELKGAKVLFENNIFEQACFNCHQAIEFALKGLIILEKGEAEISHNLKILSKKVGSPSEIERMDKKEIINEVKKFKKKLMKKYKIDKMLLFGSYARGKYNKYSDIDLMIISEDFRKIHILDRNYGLYLLWDLEKDVDFLCYTSEEVKRHSQAPTICRTALKEGIEV